MDCTVIPWSTSWHYPTCTFPAMRDPVSGKHGGQHPGKQHPKLTYSMHTHMHTHIPTLSHTCEHAQTCILIHTHSYKTVWDPYGIWIFSAHQMSEAWCLTAGTTGGQGTLWGKNWVRTYLIQAVPMSPARVPGVSSHFSTANSSRSALTVRLYTFQRFCNSAPNQPWSEISETGLE